MTVRIPPSTSDNRSEVYTVDFRETAPALANKTMYRHDPMSAQYGGLSVGVPGELRGLEEAHRRWGKLPWNRLVQPSVDLANGWKVDKELGKRIPWYGPLMLYDPDWSSIFAPKGSFLREGDMIRRTNYSRTLAVIGSEGAGAFYEGPIADSIVRKVRSTGGIITHADLANYKVKVGRALEGTYRGMHVYTTHAPTSGPVLLHMLNLLENFDLVAEGWTGLNVHRIVEAIKFGFAARTKLSDPAFNDNTPIATKAFADLVFANFTDDMTHPPKYYNPEYDIDIDHGTSHTSVIDQDGMVVSLTSTVNLIFGSKVLDPETGVILNDEMDDFSLPGQPNAFGLWPSPYNYPEPGKRPLSSTAPTIVEHPNGTFFIALGGSGGTRIFPSILQVILNIDWDMNVSEAVERGRLHNQLYPQEVDADDVYPAAGLDALRERGHNVVVSDVNRVAGAIQAVVQRGGKISAASDSRKNGIAAGY